MYDLLNDASLTLGQRFKYFREQKGLSQISLAEGICSYSTISHLENDRSIPSPKLMGKLADKLGVPLCEIMGKQEIQLDAGFQIDMVRVYVERADYNHALQLIDELETREDLLEHQRFELMLSRIDCLIKLKKSQEAIEIISPFLEHQEIIQSMDDERMCTTYNKLGNAYYRQADFEKAYSAYERAYKISLKLQQPNIVGAKVTFNMGLTCAKLGFKDDAVIYLERSYKFFNSISDLESVANVIFALAVETEDPNQLLHARSLYESLNLIHEANRVKLQYAFMIDAKADYKKAVSELKKIAKDYEELGDLGFSVFTFAKALHVSLDNQDYREVELCFKDASNQYEKLMQDEPFFSSYYYRVKAEYFLYKRDFDQCVINGERSCQFYDTMSMYAESAEVLRICAKAFEQLENYQQAYEYSNKALDVLLKTQQRRTNP